PVATGVSVASIEYSDAEVSQDLRDYRFHIAKSVARIGHLGVFTEAEIRGAWNTATLAQAGFEDTLTINAAGLTGQSGYFIAKMRVSGSLLADASNNGTIYTGKSETKFSAILGGNGAYANLDGGYVRSFDAQSFESYGDIPGLMQVQVPFTFGSAFNLSGQLTVQSFAAGNTVFNNVWAWSRAEFGHTAYIEGIDEVFTIDDGTVSDFSVASVSGSDYIVGFENTVIPESGAYAVVCGALALVVVAGSRRSLRADVRSRASTF
ncbi:MAG: hypothetical protein ABW223_04580, partial [Rariglobus sp.]